MIFVGSAGRTAGIYRSGIHPQNFLNPMGTVNISQQVHDRGSPSGVSISSSNYAPGSISTSNYTTNEVVGGTNLGQSRRSSGSSASSNLIQGQYAPNQIYLQQMNQGKVMQLSNSGQMKVCCF